MFDFENSFLARVPDLMESGMTMEAAIQHAMDQEQTLIGKAYAEAKADYTPSKSLRRNREAMIARLYAKFHIEEIQNEYTKEMGRIYRREQ